MQILVSVEKRNNNNFRSGKAEADISVSLIEQSTNY